MAASFDGYSTRDLMRVARVVTPSGKDERRRWTLTFGERVWRQEGDSWIAYHLDGEPYMEFGYIVSIPDPDMRVFVVEQLEHFGVTPDGWEMEAH
jgi:hypothetical protein